MVKRKLYDGRSIRMSTGSCADRASQWIQYYTAFELVSLLNDTSKTLTEVSDLMNFENISHFSRYVKKTLGKTPSAYRQKQS